MVPDRGPKAEGGRGTQSLAIDPSQIRDCDIQGQTSLNRRTFACKHISLVQQYTSKTTCENVARNESKILEEKGRQFGFVVNFIGCVLHPAIPKTKNPKARWVKPKFLAEVEYFEISRDGSLRHPVLRGFRSARKN